MTQGENRQRISSGGPWEAIASYSRAVRVGNQVFVSGTTSVKDGKVVGIGDAGSQAEQALDTISTALHAAGSSLDEVVRYRVYLTNIADSEAVIPVLRSFLGSARPAGTLVAVSDLIMPEMLIEIEVDAIIGSATPDGL
jgi:enamine deaminase RidA (YjgF/YER057c/UK114 family)